MRILSIETSCDETAVALLEVTGEVNQPEVKILGNTLYSQAKLHEEYGGVYPNLAKREHEKNLPILLQNTLKEAGFDRNYGSIDLIAVTAGPGLEPALWTGITFAEKLGKDWGKPVMPVNHMEGHIFSVLCGGESSAELKLPALALLVSGGHTELVQISELGTYKILGKTLDDAVGEAFDKVARMLGLPYPGGPQISYLAELDRQKNAKSLIDFPRPMIHSKNLDFSFSGLKTAVLYYLKSQGEISDEHKASVARAFEDAVIEVLINKTRKALEQSELDFKTLIVAGGVAANSKLREAVAGLRLEFPELSISFPIKLLATDNAIMIGLAGFIEATLHPEKMNAGPIKAQGNLSFS